LAVGIGIAIGIAFSFVVSPKVPHEQRRLSRVQGLVFFSPSPIAIAMPRWMAMPMAGF
jgi:hypothetical protein